MLQSIRRLAKPEYIFRPRQIGLRLLRAGRPKKADFRVMGLPWRTPIRAGIHDTVGFAIWHLGVYELVVSEVLWRLIDSGEAVADVGANFGYMTSLMAARSGIKGTVTSFEPHPQVFEMLRQNVTRWRGAAVAIAPVEVLPNALSEARGVLDLMMPVHFEENGGTAFLRGSGNPASVAGLASVPVQVRRFDEVFQAPARLPMVVKIDVEGAEAQVLRGAGDLISRRLIRDIVFEDHGSYPTPAMELLKSHGYTLFRLQRSFMGPCLADPASLPPDQKDAWEPENYLATSQPERALARMKRFGWQCLRAHLPET